MGNQCHDLSAMFRLPLPARDPYKLSPRTQKMADRAEALGLRFAKVDGAQPWKVTRFTPEWPGSAMGRESSQYFRTLAHVDHYLTNEEASR